MTCYILAHVEVVDPAAYGVYAAAVLEQLAAVGGRVLAAGPVDGLEGPAMTNHNVVLEFDDEATARSWFESDAYQAVVPLRWAASASSQISILPGWDEP
jgi:uncharacterized protein (DUF1330 family)